MKLLLLNEKPEYLECNVDVIKKHNTDMRHVINSFNTIVGFKADSVLY